MSFSVAVKRVCILMLSLLCYAKLYAEEPWYSGPLLSDPAIVTPIGHGYVQWHVYKIYNYGQYNINYNFESLPQATTGEIDTTLNYGLTQDTEVQIFMTYVDNRTEGKGFTNLGDTTLAVSKQLLLQNGRKWPPNIKVFYRQVFPTGHYDQLNENLFGTDATGQGSYLNTFAVNMEHVTHLTGQHYLIEFVTLLLTYANRIRLQGPSIYGGGAETDGTMRPGNSIAFNLAMEYSPAQRWGFIMETYIYAQKASKFKGVIGSVAPRFTEGGSRQRRAAASLSRRRGSNIIFNRLRPSSLNLGSGQGIGHGNIAEFTLAPAIDYTFSKDVALTAGVWFTVAGKNTPAFYAPMISFTANW